MISFIIPALNEAEHIESTVDTIYAAVSAVELIDKFEIVIIDDGSVDLTEQKTKSLKSKFSNITYEKNEKNFGMGYSIKKALKIIKYKKFIIIPGGNDIEINTIVSSLKFYNNSDLIMQYPTNTEDRTKLRNIMSKIYSLIFIIFFDCNVYYINGASIFPTEQVKSLKLNSNRHGIIAEMVTKLMRTRITFCEVPIFYKFPHKIRSTITLKNFLDVSISFINLLIEFKIKNRQDIKAKRNHINY